MNTEKIVSRIINEWDPIGLLAGGAPSNEYDIEIKDICKKITMTSTDTELSMIIFESFKNKMNISLNQLSCLEYSFKIMEEIKPSK